MKRLTFVLVVFTLLFVSCQQDVSAYLDRISDLERENSSSQEENTELQVQISELTSQLQSVQEELVTLKADIASKEAEIAELEEQLAASQNNSSSSSSSEEEDSAEQIQELRDKILDLNSAKSSLEQRLSSLQATESELRQQLADSSAHVNQMIDLISDRIEALEASKAEVELELQALHYSELGIYQETWENHRLFSGHPSYVDWDPVNTNQLIIDLTKYSESSQFDYRVRNFVVYNNNFEVIPCPENSSLCLLYYEPQFYWGPFYSSSYEDVSWDSIEGSAVLLTETEMQDIQQTLLSCLENPYGLSSEESTKARQDVIELTFIENQVLRKDSELKSLEAKIQEASYIKSALLSVEV